MTLNVVKGKFMWAKLTKKEQLTEDLWKMWLKPEIGRASCRERVCIYV